MKRARAAVDVGKIGLGEGGPVWWDDSEPDVNKLEVTDIPWANWYRLLGKSASFSFVVVSGDSISLDTNLEDEAGLPTQEFLHLLSPPETSHELRTY